MTYKECYMQFDSPEKAKRKALEDTKVAIFLGNNPDRLKAIEDALNDTMKEKGWYKE